MEQTISVERVDYLSGLFGMLDENVRTISRELDVMITIRDSQIKITGEPENVLRAKEVIEGLLKLLERGEEIDSQKLNYVISMVRYGQQTEIEKLGRDVVCITMRGRQVKAKTVGQQKYIDAIQKSTITIGVGPAGTGKTYLAVACAVAAFRQKTVNKIILTRPAVEAGEKLGFLPGDLHNKVHPYLRPLYDALFEMMGAEAFQRYTERGNIEVAPLAYMRGRTLDDAFIILDEAQNTTSEQMKMFLTRMGMGSKMVITGDITQIDLPEGKKSGLKEAVSVLRGIDDIDIIMLDHTDVVRHELVSKIIRAYENKYREKRRPGNGKAEGRN